MILWFSQQLRQLELENERVLVFFRRGVVFTYIATVERCCFPKKQQTHLYMVSIQRFFQFVEMTISPGSASYVKLKFLKSEIMQNVLFERIR